MLTLPYLGVLCRSTTFLDLGVVVIVVLGIVVLLAAVVAGAAGILTDGGSGHGLTLVVIGSCDNCILSDALSISAPETSLLHRPRSE